MKNYRTIISFIIISTLLSLFACNEEAKDLPEENYQQLFGNEVLNPPYQGYETMPKLPCEPDISKEDYIYPGVTIEEKRNYTVTLKFYFKEKSQYFENQNKTYSQVFLRYVNEHKQLAILKTYTDFEETGRPDFQNGKPFVRKFKASSGFPLYLGIWGAGWDAFEMKASLQAISDDGLIETPEIHYENKLYTDGFSPDFSFCQKIILP